MTHPGANSSPKGPERDAAAVKVFPPGIPLVTVGVGVLLDWSAPVGADLMLQGAPRYIVGTMLTLAPIYLLGVRAVRALRATGQSENPYKPTTEIIETGPFRYTRNPMYLQMVLACLGVSVLLANLWITLLTPVCAVLLQVLVIRHEEAYLERKFGTDYGDYKRRVRRWI